ncbi:DUF4174 domain-containing protein [Methylobacterium sp. BTF04]|uniref:DUF4174 domain-containing protein n=1 Tax=Methylobacterium sp. BTF04 TaxID=2708300 RepID=UPI001FF06A38|nr:DUF4174 domain-containing protein [Methylobacterium sp. BTF04]
MASGWMVLCATLLAGGATLTGIGATRAADDPLGAYRWTSRVLVISATDGADPRLVVQRSTVAAAKAGMAERDLVTIEILGQGDSARRLRDRLGLPRDGFRVLLIGKDGGAKLNRDEPIPTRTLFDTIDAMPMRREESRR